MKAKDQLIEIAADLIRTKGYFGTGITEILTSTGIPKGSLYHHFPGGKDELVKYAMERAAIKYAEEFKIAMKGKGSAAEGLKAIVDIYIKGMKGKKEFVGCPLASVTMDLSTQNNELRDTCKKLFNFWIDATASYLEYKGIKDPKRKSESFMIRLEGAILLSAAQQSPRAFELIKSEIPNLLKN